MFPHQFARAAGRPFKPILTAVFALALLLAAGCSKEDVTKMANSVKEKTASIAESGKEVIKQGKDAVTQGAAIVKEQLPESGKVTLQVSPPLEIPSASIEVISIGDGRKNVVQIANYDVAAAPKSYPSILIQGTTTAGDPASLAGQTVACELYMREGPTSPIAMTAAGQPAQVTFKSFDPQEKTVAADIGAAGLIGSDNHPVAFGGGKILAVISDGGS